MRSLVQDLLAYARITTEEDRLASYSLDQDLEIAISLLLTAIKDSEAVVTHDPLPEVQNDQRADDALISKSCWHLLEISPERRPV